MPDSFLCRCGSVVETIITFHVTFPTPDATFLFYLLQLRVSLQQYSNNEMRSHIIKRNVYNIPDCIHGRWNLRKLNSSCVIRAVFLSTLPSTLPSLLPSHSSPLDTSIRSSVSFFSFLNGALCQQRTHLLSLQHTHRRLCFYLEVKCDCSCDFFFGRNVIHRFLRAGLFSCVLFFAFVFSRIHVISTHGKSLRFSLFGRNGVFTCRFAPSNTSAS